MYRQNNNFIHASPRLNRSKKAVRAKLHIIINLRNVLLSKHNLSNHNIFVRITPENHSCEKWLSDQFISSLQIWLLLNKKITPKWKKMWNIFFHSIQHILHLLFEDRLFWSGGEGGVYISFFVTRPISNYILTDLLYPWHLINIFL